MTVAETARVIVRRVPTWPVYLAGAVPAIWLFWLAFTGGLGADPAVKLERALGEWALRFLFLSLAVTPLLRVSGINLVKYRRALGLSALLLAVLHVGVYAVLVQALDIQLIIEDLYKRPYITLGMVSFVLLVALGLTSNSTSIKRLGASAWQKLHKLAYPAAVLAVLHFFLIIKAWPVEPLIYGAILAVLFALRLPAFDRRRVARA